MSILEIVGNNDIGRIDLYIGVTFASLSDWGTIPVDGDLFISIVTGYEVSYLSI